MKQGNMKKRLLIYIIALVVYIFLPGIVQQIFMKYDDYYFYIILAVLSIVNLMLAFNILKLSNKLSYIIAVLIVTTIGVLSTFVVANLNLGWNGIRIALWSNALISILTWEVVFQFYRKKTAANSGFPLSRVLW